MPDEEDDLPLTDPTEDGVEGDGEEETKPDEEEMSGDDAF